MLFSELSGKILVNLENGEVLGNIGEADLLIDEHSGEIDSILLPGRNHVFERSHGDHFAIKWNDIKKIGAEVVVVDIDMTYRPLR
jgi:YlmC/YmxH family sporulation protein